MTTPTTALGAKDVADKIGTDAKTLRVFLRASPDYEAPGSGGRYSFIPKDVPTLKSRFNKWLGEREMAKAAMVPMG